MTIEAPSTHHIGDGEERHCPASEIPKNGLLLRCHGVLKDRYCSPSTCYCPKSGLHCSRYGERKSQDVPGDHITREDLDWPHGLTSPNKHKLCSRSHLQRLKVPCTMRPTEMPGITTKTTVQCENMLHSIKIWYTAVRRESRVVTVV